MEEGACGQVLQFEGRAWLLPPHATVKPSLRKELCDSDLWQPAYMSTGRPTRGCRTVPVCCLHTQQPSHHFAKELCDTLLRQPACSQLADQRGDVALSISVGSTRNSHTVTAQKNCVTRTCCSHRVRAMLIQRRDEHCPDQYIHTQQPSQHFANAPCELTSGILCVNQPNIQRRGVVLSLMSTPHATTPQKNRVIHTYGGLRAKTAGHPALGCTTARDHFIHTQQPSHHFKRAVCRRPAAPCVQVIWPVGRAIIHQAQIEVKAKGLSFASNWIAPPCSSRSKQKP
jgi:hypothetical protein